VRMGIWTLPMLKLSRNKAASNNADNASGR
jgi:hypothetical protein